jgi:hypothetical protein
MIVGLILPQILILHLLLNLHIVDKIVKYIQVKKEDGGSGMGQVDLLKAVVGGGEGLFKQRDDVILGS